jgi:hypothetical protein
MMAKTSYSLRITRANGASCSPNGIHRYFFKVYALDQKLSLTSYAIMEGHILARVELIGRY